MRHLRLLAWSALAFFFVLALSGCFLTNLQPWHVPGTAITDPALVGTWRMENCSGGDETKGKFCQMTFTPHRGSVGGPEGKDEDGYAVEFRGENGQESTFYTYLFEAGGERFLESEVNEGPKVDPAFVVHTVLTHVVWHVRVENSELTLEPIQLAWATQQARDGKLPAHVMTANGETPLLNVGPAEATAFLAQHAKDPAIYDKPFVWKKGAAPSAAAPKAKGKMK